MSTAFHPETDGQMERLNQTIKAYLRTFASHEQDNWTALLPMAEFADNNLVTIGNGMSPFYSNYGFHPVVFNPTASEPLNLANKLYTHWMHTVHEKSTKRLEAVQEWIRHYTDPKRTKPPKYQVGDLVMLNRCNNKMYWLSKKLDHKNHSPIELEKVFSPYRSTHTSPKMENT